MCSISFIIEARLTKFISIIDRPEPLFTNGRVMTLTMTLKIDRYEISVLCLTTYVDVGKHLYRVPSSFYYYYYCFFLNLLLLLVLLKPFNFTRREQKVTVKYHLKGCCSEKIWQHIARTFVLRSSTKC